MNLFKQPSVKEQVRTQQRELRTVQRGLDREQDQLDKQEKQLEAEIKKAAKQGNQAAAKQLAKQLIRVRNMKQKNMGVKAQVSAVSHRTQSIASTHAMTTAMKGTTKVMKNTNKAMNLGKIQSTMQEFEKQNMEMEMKEEMMNDTIDSVMDEEEDEMEGEEIMNQVLEEIGIEFNEKAGSVPLKAPGSNNAINLEDNDDIKARLSALKDL